MVTFSPTDERRQPFDQPLLGEAPHHRADAHVEAGGDEVAPVEPADERQRDRLRRRRVEGEIAAHLVGSEETPLVGEQPHHLLAGVRVAQHRLRRRHVELGGEVAQQRAQLGLARLAQALQHLLGPVGHPRNCTCEGSGR